MSNRRLSYEECIAWVLEQPAWAWSLPWWRTAEIIVKASGRVWSVKDSSAFAPAAIELLGCTAVDRSGQAAWVGWDLDVGEHGTTSYPDTAAAVADARRLRDALDGRAEIRLSKSGQGVHVRSLLHPAEIPATDGVKIAKGLAAKLALRADATPLGRQAFWLWARNPKPHAFELVEPHEGLSA